MENNPIYSDKLVDVCDGGLRIKKYYFPSGQAKFVKYSEVFAIERKPSTLKHGKWRCWGTGDFKTWFSLDWGRPQRESLFFIRFATQRMSIGFSVENTKAFTEAMESKGMTILKV